MSTRARLGTLLLAALVLAPPAFGAATITIVNGDPAGVGFNDPTVVAPVGGNSGTTLGQQRLIAFQAAADKWGTTLTSTVQINVLATWEALSCTATSAVLGSAGATEVWRNVTGMVTDHWYGKAEADKFAGSDLDANTPDIRARFNVNLGQTGCLTGIFWYLGLDNNHGSNIDLVTVLTHEFAHGLGFQTYTNGSTGAQLGGYPSIWDDFLLDTSTGKTWTAMSATERVASAINTDKLVWTGTNVTTAIPSVLSLGTPQLTVSAPVSVAGTYLVGTASFGPALSSPGVGAEVMPVVDLAGNLGLACNAFSTPNAAGVNGKIALVDRGTCTFTVKAANAQAAGAVGVLVADNAAGSPPAGLGGTDPTITIPTVRITQADGVTLKNAMATRSRLHSGLLANLGVNLSVRAGADASGRALMYTPNPYQSGSSVSHWDTSMFPNQLMEPNINSDLTHEVTPPTDLTFPLLQDIGW
ncbi:MAG TPA: PA domain-containing protein [Thermoanaerobaculaceae bacterium]|nr:PA domain-containing protein [Thermoanaerobaculaceae bacterium]